MDSNDFFFERDAKLKNLTELPFFGVDAPKDFFFSEKENEAIDDKENKLSSEKSDHIP